MATYARGRDVQIRLMKDGELLGVWSPDSASFNIDEDLERDERLGETESRNTKVMNGSSGTMTFKTEDSTLDELQIAEADDYRSGAKVTKYQILRTKFFPKNGTSKTLVYPDVVFNWSTDASGKNNAVTTSIDWQGKLPREL